MNEVLKQIEDRKVVRKMRKLERNIGDYLFVSLGLFFLKINLLANNAKIVPIPTKSILSKAILISAFISAGAKNTILPI